MRADAIDDRDASWLPLVHAVVAASAIAISGALGSIQVWILTLAGAIVSY